MAPQHSTASSTVTAGQVYHAATIAVHLECIELGLNAKVLLPAAAGNSRATFPKLVSTLVAGGFCGSCYDVTQNTDLERFDAEVERREMRRKEQQEFYTKVEASFSDMAETMARMKRDYYREVDNLREQISRMKGDAAYEPDSSVIFFDPSGYRLPLWSEILEELDGLRMRRELLQEDLGGGRVKKVPIHMLCPRCRGRFESVDEDNIGHCHRETQTESTVGTSDWGKAVNDTALGARLSNSEVQTGMDYDTAAIGSRVGSGSAIGDHIECGGGVTLKPSSILQSCTADSMDMIGRTDYEQFHSEAHLRSNKDVTDLTGAGAIDSFGDAFCGRDGNNKKEGRGSAYEESTLEASNSFEASAGDHQGATVRIPYGEARHGEKEPRSDTAHSAMLDSSSGDLRMGMSDEESARDAERARETPIGSESNTTEQIIPDGQQLTDEQQRERAALMGAALEKLFAKDPAARRRRAFKLWKQKKMSKKELAARALQRQQEAFQRHLARIAFGAWRREVLGGRAPSSSLLEETKQHTLGNSSKAPLKQAQVGGACRHTGAAEQASADRPSTGAGKYSDNSSDSCSVGVKRPQSRPDRATRCRSAVALGSSNAAALGSTLDRRMASKGGSDNATCAKAVCRNGRAEDRHASGFATESWPCLAQQYSPPATTRLSKSLLPGGLSNASSPDLRWQGCRLENASGMSPPADLDFGIVGRRAMGSVAYDRFGLGKSTSLPRLVPGPCKARGLSSITRSTVVAT